MQKLILASGSPRRRDFLNNMGISFVIQSPDVDETALENESPSQLVMRLSKLKAMSVSAQHPHDVVLSADTVVVIDNEILGKPSDRADAKAMIKKLSGRTHEVFTAVCVCQGSRCEQIMEITKVTFAPLSDELIDLYAASGECDDKSGSYALQGIAAMLIEKVEGSVSSVVGLPACQTRELLQKFGINPGPVSAA